MVTSNNQLRTHREATTSPSRPGFPMSRAELADAVNAYIWARNGKRICLDADTVGRYERGVIRWPSTEYRDGLRAILGASADGDLGFHPTRRGRSAISQTHTMTEYGEVSTSFEGQTDPVDRRDFLRTIGAASAVAVTGGVGLPPTGDESPRLVADLAAIRHALLAAPTSPSRTSLPDLAGNAEAAHAAYQAARYDDLARTLPALLAATAGLGMSPSARAVHCQAMLVTAKLLTKIGDGQFAHVAADRARQAAIHANHHALTAGAAYQVACAVLKTHGPDDARAVSDSAFGSTNPRTPTDISYHGSLALISAVAAARAGDANAADGWLKRAKSLAEELGKDANLGWTAFGPTNVRIHEVSVAVELRRPVRAIELSASVDTDLLPLGLHSRRSQLHLDSAWAYAAVSSDAEAVISLLEAERFAPQTVRHSPTAKTIVTEMTKRRATTPGLAALARRIGVAA